MDEAAFPYLQNGQRYTCPAGTTTHATHPPPYPHPSLPSSMRPAEHPTSRTGPAGSITHDSELLDNLLQLVAAGADTSQLMRALGAMPTHLRALADQMVVLRNRSDALGSGRAGASGASAHGGAHAPGPTGPPPSHDQWHPATSAGEPPSPDRACVRSITRKRTRKADAEGGDPSTASGLGASAAMGAPAPPAGPKLVRKRAKTAAPPGTPSSYANVGEAIAASETSLYQ